LGITRGDVLWLEKKNPELHVSVLSDGKRYIHSRALPDWRKASKALRPSRANLRNERNG
jgi:hypothetical protein